ncbi:hypothetical protein BCIN_04g06580 [Botrytis cinerea B05.10]|uniref:SMP domain-containing protein n=1 Tax=Botryotinia fuckeliana (strain B05.10) TaxID=332648 RepID=A0A384JGI3_BOTFB|nr:hypothetical protein BCIN_04g06580 [Botrytis cinerea B05.10]ATZ49521.1 hypothetical protein BCIN_04g06580 [Botrytis cinerea B05.10]
MPTKMTKDDASRIQSTQAQGGKDMSSSGFAARAQGAGDRNANTGGYKAGQGTGGGNAGQAGSDKK